MASGRLALRGLGPGSDDRCLSARAWAAAFAGKEKEKELPVRFDYGGNGTNGQCHVTLRRAELCKSRQHKFGDEYEPGETRMN